MNTIRVFGALAVTLTLGFSPLSKPTLSAQPNVGGVVEGRVFDAATGDALRNARVTIEGTRNETLTNENGEFRLPNLPAGEVTIKATYGSMPPQMARVTLTGGSVQRQDFNLARAVDDARAENVVRLQEFTVQSANYSARTAGAGALVELSTRSGTG